MTLVSDPNFYEEVVSANGWDALDPLGTTLQLLPCNDMSIPVPEVDSGIFDPSYETVLTMVTYSNDPVIPRDDHEALYPYLTNDQSLSGLVLVEDENPAHEYHGIIRELILDALSGILP